MSVESTKSSSQSLSKNAGAVMGKCIKIFVKTNRPFCLFLTLIETLHREMSEGTKP